MAGAAFAFIRPPEVNHYLPEVCRDGSGYHTTPGSPLPRLAEPYVPPTVRSTGLGRLAMSGRCFDRWSAADEAAARYMPPTAAWTTDWESVEARAWWRRNSHHNTSMHGVLGEHAVSATQGLPSLPGYPRQQGYFEQDMGIACAYAPAIGAPTRHPAHPQPIPQTTQHMSSLPAAAAPAQGTRTRADYWHMPPVLPLRDIWPARPVDMAHTHVGAAAFIQPPGAYNDPPVPGVVFFARSPQSLVDQTQYPAPFPPRRRNVRLKDMQQTSVDQSIQPTRLPHILRPRSVPPITVDAPTAIAFDIDTADNAQPPVTIVQPPLDTYDLPLSEIMEMFRIRLEEQQAQRHNV